MNEIDGLAPGQHVHFIGIGGIGVSGLARILHQRGFNVTGSDSVAGEQTDALAAAGLPVNIGHTLSEQAANADLVVISAAVSEQNQEVVSARAAGVKVIKRAELLGLLANSGRSIAVAGSHGKSSTSGMIASALIDLEESPTYVIGAVLASSGSNAAPGDSEIVVVEADEFDRSFHWLTPDIAIITNVEYDHPDIFIDRNDYEAAFAEFIRRIRPEGTLIIAGDDSGGQRVLQNGAVAPGVEIITFGESGDQDWTITRRSDTWEAVGKGGESLPLRLSVPGRHNVRNATAALIALQRIGIPTAAAVAALNRYRGIGRRFEEIGEVTGITVIDDYAHHPTEVIATLEAARQRFGNRRLIAVFQPHTYSRTKALLEQFAESFQLADEVMLLDIYAAREKNDLGVSSSDLSTRMTRPVLMASDPAAAAHMLAAIAKPGDVVMTLGAGDVTRTGPMLINLLEANLEATDR